MNKTIYLDNAATTAVDPEVVDAMTPYFGEIYGNPGSMHSSGLGAGKAVEASRASMAGILNSRPEEIVFTGGGTESINIALKGVAMHYGDGLKKGRHIVSQKTEHAAVLETLKYLEKEGFEITLIDVDKSGMVSPEELKAAIREDTILVSIMYVNNEIGTIQPLSELGKICKKRKVLFHTDACQASNLLSLDVSKLNVDLMSLNASKVYGPKGVGLLYIKRGVILTQLIHGGGQEFGKRSGTENVPGIVGFAKALEISEDKKKTEKVRMKDLSEKLINGILSTIPKSFLNGNSEARLFSTVNITILDIEGEALLLYLDKEGIAASSGSACTSSKLDPSHVIIGTGLPYEAAHGSLRFSLGRWTTKDDVEKVIEILPKIVKRLRNISPVNLDVEDFKEYMTEENFKISKEMEIPN